MSAGLYRARAARIAAGVSCAFVGESDVRDAGTPRRARSTDVPGPRVVERGQPPARGQSGSCESVDMPRS